MSSIIIVVVAVIMLVFGAVAVIIAFTGEDTTDAKAAIDGPGTADDNEPQQDDTMQKQNKDGDASPVLTKTLARTGLLERLQWQLLQSGLRLRPSELAALALGAGGLGFAVGLVLRGLIAAIILGILATAAPIAYTYMRRGARQKAVNGQLAEALSMMASSLRSGYSFLRAMQIVVDEMDPPISEEFDAVLDELNVGISYEQALNHLHERCPTDDIYLVVTACQIQAKVGGNLSEILETASDMVRERERLEGEIAALTAEGRMSATILGGLPIFLGVVIHYLNPGYLAPLFETKIGLYMLAAAGAAMLTGIIVIKKMMAADI